MAAPATMQSGAMLRSGAMAQPATMQSGAMLRSGAMAQPATMQTAGDYAARSDEKERRR
jgi:hypothetical protein